MINEKNYLEIENKKLFLKALEIAVTLTGAKENWLERNADGNIKMEQKLFDTLRHIIKIMNDTSLLAVKSGIQVLTANLGVSKP